MLISSDSDVMLAAGGEATTLRDRKYHQGLILQHLKALGLFPCLMLSFKLVLLMMHVLQDFGATVILITPI